MLYRRCFFSLADMEVPGADLNITPGKNAIFFRKQVATRMAASHRARDQIRLD